jgi:hypothetical protein
MADAPKESALGRMLAVVGDQVERLRRPPHRAQKALHLAAVVRSMIDDVQDNLPGRRFVRIAFEIRVGNLCADVGEPRDPFCPLIEQRRPLLLQDREMHVEIGIDELRRRIPLDSTQPDPVRSVDMNQRAQHGLVGCSKIANQFLGVELAGCFNQPRRGPARVINVSEQNFF